MNLITKRLTLCLMLCIGLSQTAFTTEEQLVPSKDFTYEGQTSETLQLSNAKTETRYREEQVPSTCTRQIPYTENQCSDETFYRQECSEVPGYENCYNVTEQVCRSEPRTRQQCHTTPGRNVCRRGPSREVCHTEGRRTCRTVPGREICRTNSTTGREVCRQLPSREVCSGKPRRVCRTVPGRETCRHVGGDRVCRDVTEYEQVCHNVNRRQCDWVPARQECQQIPYTQNVCRDVTLYRTETYDCMETVQIPYTVTLKKFFAELNFEEFRSVNPGAKAIFKSTLTTEGKLTVVAEDKSETSSIIFAKKKVVPVDETEEEIQLKIFYKVNFMDKALLLAPVQKELANVKLAKKYLAFEMGRVSVAKALVLKVKIERGDDVFIDRELLATEFTLTDKDGMSAVHIDLEKLGVKKLKRKEHNVVIEINIKPAGQVLNLKAPKLKKVKELKLKAQRK